MRKAFVLCPVLVLAALMSGCGGITMIPTTMLRVTRDIAAGEVIREADLKTYRLANGWITTMTIRAGLMPPIA